MAVESALLNSPAAADISMQAHDREWTPLHGHTQAVTALAYTVDGMFMLSGVSRPPSLSLYVPRCVAKGLCHHQVATLQYCRKMGCRGLVSA